MVLRSLEPLIAPDTATTRLVLDLTPGCGLPSDLAQCIAQAGGKLRRIQFVGSDLDEGLQVVLNVKGSAEMSRQALVERLCQQPAIRSARVV